MLISDITTPMSKVLADAGNDSYLLADLIIAVNEAIEIVCSVQPGVYRETANIDLIAGLLQTIPADAETLLSIEYNTGSDGATVDRTVKYTTKEEKDADDVDWPTTTATLVVQQYMYNPEKDPKSYYVYPPMSGATKVMATVSKVPDAADAVGDTFELASTYRTPVMELALYRMFSRDAANTGNYTRAQSHFQKGMQLLGVVVQIPAQIEAKQTDRV